MSRLSVGVVLVVVVGSGIILPGCPHPPAAVAPPVALYVRLAAIARRTLSVGTALRFPLLYPTIAQSRGSLRALPRRGIGLFVIQISVCLGHLPYASSIKTAFRSKTN